MRRGLWSPRSGVPSAGKRLASAFAELYGREREEDITTSAVVPMATSSTRNAPSLTSSTASTVTRLLTQYDDQRYVDPSGCSPAVARDTLAAVRAALQDRRTDGFDSDRERAHVWRHALAILADTSRAELVESDARSDALQAASECVAVLWLARQHAAALTLAEQTVSTMPPASFDSTTTAAYCATATLLTACLVGSGETGTPLSASTTSAVEATLAASKSRAHGAAKEEKAHVAQACAGLVWAADWLWHFHPALLPKAWTAATLRAHALPWMAHVCEGHISAESALAVQSPPAHMVKAASAASAAAGDGGGAARTSVDGETLKRLYLSATTRTRDSPALFFFDLPTRLGELVLTTPAVPPATKAAVLASLGTALSPASVATYAAATRKSTSLDSAVDVLGRMHGPTAYHALRRLARTASTPHLLASVQRLYGDLMSAHAGDTWQRALTSVEQAMARGDSAWQRQVPHALRLLADAEKPAAFLALLREHRPESATNAVVAASLASVMRQTGRWWHALEVVDLIATATVPQSESEDLFLQEAALDTLTALRHAQRWQTCLSVYATLQPLWQPAYEAEVSSVMWSTVVEMPVGAPWEAASLLLARTLPAPKSATTLLALTRASESDAQSRLRRWPRHPKARQRLLFLLSSHGRWRTLAAALALPTPDTDTTTVVWRHVLRAMAHAPCEPRVEAMQACLDTLPVSVLLEEPTMLRHALRVCLRFGCLDTFDTLLARLLAAPTQTPPPSTAPRALVLGREYTALLAFLREGRMVSPRSKPAVETEAGTGTASAPVVVVVSDRFIAQQFLRHVSAAPRRIQYVWPSGTGKGHYLRHLRKPDAVRQLARDMGCVADQVQLKDRAKGCAWLYAPRAEPLPSAHLIVSSERALVAFKPLGAVLSKTAVGAAMTAKRSEVFLPLYDMPPGWSGLFVLRPSLLRQAGLPVRLGLVVQVVPLWAEAVPLMATGWWSRYACEVRPEGHAALARGVTVECSVRTDGHESVDEAIAHWRATLNADGWGIVEGEAGVSGESVHVADITVDEMGTGAATEPMEATTSLLPHWLPPPLPASENGEDEPFDELAFLGDTSTADDGGRTLHT